MGLSIYVHCKITTLVQAKLSLCLTKHCIMKKYGGEEIHLCPFLTSALDRGKWAASCPNHALSLGKEPVVATGWATELVYTQWR
jgi:hypothetical protein